MYVCMYTHVWFCEASELIYALMDTEKTWVFDQTKIQQQQQLSY